MLTLIFDILTTFVKLVFYVLSVVPSIFYFIFPAVSAVFKVLLLTVAPSTVWIVQKFLMLLPSIVGGTFNILYSILSKLPFLLRVSLYIAGIFFFIVGKFIDGVVYLFSMTAFLLKAIVGQTVASFLSLASSVLIVFLAVIMITLAVGWRPKTSIPLVFLSVGIYFHFNGSYCTQTTFYCDFVVQLTLFFSLAWSLVSVLLYRNRQRQEQVQEREQQQQQQQAQLGDKNLHLRHRRNVGQEDKDTTPNIPKLVRTNSSKIRKYDPKSGNIDEKITFFQESFCPICYIDYVKDEKIRALPCGHTYHEKCISEWFTSCHNNNCPACGKNVSTFGWIVHALFE